ncbi:acyl-CoA dehydrogenase family protein [Rhodococcus opacus]|uniref:acyl-CoA dehydrogenase family protein n=1 Tax=Rhodococcus opacus TaxID=37919 RepID=UPI0024771902|nr:acyl-CoA dehydrogenase family protein [Rhodococcus opacus]MDH6291329.1 alkylation response protein AidB-like acyl-CoA dehydrogenase [Rhodococcus opacus]
MVESVSEFGERLRSWLEDNLGPGVEATGWSAEDRRRTTQAMFDAGFIGTTWPVEYGGRGLSSEYQTEYNNAVGARKALLANDQVTVGICAPTVFDCGTEAQRQTYLQRMLRGDDSWTQLLSEPGAGSDLAGVTTRAVLDGDEWVVNGQKVWTSAAVGATYGLALVRTDSDLPKYAGISTLIIPMDSPGVDVRPLKQMSGDSDFNEVFLDNVRVPKDNLLGELNDGWAVLGKMLTHERIALSAGTISSSMVSDEFDALLALAQARGVVNRPDVRHVLSEIYMQQKLLDFTGIRMRRALDAKAPMGPVGSIGKIGAAKLARLTGEANILIGGESTVAWRETDSLSPKHARALLRFPIVGIAGGTTEIQKNVVAERVLGLPRERRADRDTPFRDIPKNR